MLELILSLFMQSSNPPASNYAGVVSTIEQIAKENPHTTRLIDIGVSESGQMIKALKIGDGSVANLIVATHHGNEYGSTAVALGAAESFAQNPIPNQTIYIIPVLNVVGYNSRNRYERTAQGNIDLNRDYPGPCIQGRPHKSRTSRILADFLVSANIVSSATLHTFFPAVLYPWGFSTRNTATEEDRTFINLSRDSVVESGYDVGNSKELLYAADGAFEDYAFWKHGIWSLLFELGSSHRPTEGQMKTMIADNVPGLRRFFENAPRTRSSNFKFTGTCDKSTRQREHLE